MKTKASEIAAAIAKKRKYAQGGEVSNNDTGETVGSIIGYPGFPKPSKPKAMAEGGEVTPSRMGRIKMGGHYPHAIAEAVMKMRKMAKGGLVEEHDDEPMEHMEMPEMDDDMFSADAPEDPKKKRRSLISKLFEV